VTSPARLSNSAPSSLMTWSTPETWYWKCGASHQSVPAIGLTCSDQRRLGQLQAGPQQLLPGCIPGRGPRVQRRRFPGVVQRVSVGPGPGRGPGGLPTDGRGRARLVRLKPVIGEGREMREVARCLTLQRARRRPVQATSLAGRDRRGQLVLHTVVLPVERLGQNPGGEGAPEHRSGLQGRLGLDRQRFQVAPDRQREGGRRGGRLVRGGTERAAPVSREPAVETAHQLLREEGIAFAAPGPARRPGPRPRDRPATLPPADECFPRSVAGAEGGPAGAADSARPAPPRRVRRARALRRGRPRARPAAPPRPSEPVR
jgi:hypothetical protein